MVRDGRILLVSLAALAAWGQAGTTLYVAPDGNDAAEGTRARPIHSNLSFICVPAFASIDES